MDGYEVMPMLDAVRTADIIICATGDKDIIREEHLLVMKDGCVMGNSGHFDNEISKTALEVLAGRPKRVRESVDEYTFPDGRTVYLIAEGRLMNLAAGQGHPVEIMDMSFAIQALSLEHLVKNHAALAAKVHNVPEELDHQVALTKLRIMGVHIDRLTDEQLKYLRGWQEGT
jgi:adenosylhomocysteinase